MSNPKELVDDRLIMLLYRLKQGEKQGTATMEEIRDFGVWAEAAMNTALKLEWLRERSGETLEVTSEGHEALERALALKRTVIFGGSVPNQGPVVSVIFPKMENLRQLQRGLTAEDLEPVLNAEHYESVYDPMEFGFPGLINYHSTLVYGEDHPLARRELDPWGYPGKYLVTVVLRHCSCFLSRGGGTRTHTGRVSNYTSTGRVWI
jgi:hypothetical protein